MASRESLGEGRLSGSGPAMELAAELSDVLYVFQVEPEACFEFVSPSVEALVGFSPAEHYDDPGLGARIVDPRDAHILASLADAAIGESIDFQVRWTARDGRTVVTQHRCRKQRRDDGSVVVYGAARDVTAQVEAREALAESEERYRLLAENASDVVTRATTEGVIEWVSPSVTQLLGWLPEELVGRTSFELAHPDDVAGARERGEALQAGGQVRNRVRLRCADGSYRWVGIGARPIRDDSGAVIGRVSGWHDATAEVEAAEALAASEEHFRLMAENASDVVVKTGRDGVMEWVSPSVYEVLGWTSDELTGRPTAMLVHPDDLERVRVARRELLGQRESRGVVEFRVATAGGGWRWMSGIGRALVDADGRVVGGIDALRDIQQEYETREQLRFLASHDALTSLATRNVALARLQSVLGHPPRQGERVAVLFIDVDGLKPLNDRFGHAAGDRIIAEVAHRIAGSVRSDDLVARFGGDEFVAILTAVDSGSDAAAVTGKIHAALAHPIPIESHAVEVSVSIGVALNEPGQDPMLALQHADSALYQAKRAGRARTVIYGQEDPGAPTSP
jgi:diguanylate cyclase (GGDEF)-like protein/PAS domain S-box-containing protein